MNDPRAIVHVVDDDADLRCALERLLRAEGYRVTTSATAHEFLLVPREEGQACIVLDLQMPGVDGLELQRLLRAADDPRPVVFLSGEGDLPSGVEAMKTGAVDFLVKPVNPAELVRTVEAALQRCSSEQARLRALAAVTERVASLTEREREVMALVVAGHPNKRIALVLGISEKTVKIHRGRAMTKMGADSVAALVRMAALVGIEPAASAPEGAGQSSLKV